MDDYLGGLPSAERTALERVRAVVQRVAPDVRDRLDGFDLSKGTIRFRPDRPLPDDVLADLIRARKNEIA
jgi:uncharacterized protein YdhG (YjbR/CyaY superfamily)